MKILPFILFIQLFAFGQLTKISGSAPQYVGKSIELYGIVDYFSMKQTLLGKTQVKEDSTFSLIVEIPATQKVIVQANNNKAYMYVQPGGNYSVFMPERDKYDPYRPNGNQVEITFFDLDSADINYKILGFERWIDDFIGNYFYLKDVKPMEFGKALDLFKANVEKAYQSDTSSYFKTFVKFSIAGLDNIQFAGERNRYEKHDFYIKYSPVSYDNDAYMEYIIGFYQNLMPRLSSETNQAVYEGILAASPTKIMQALGGEYTLINTRIREMIMLKALTEVYYSDDYPQTNIITIMDSVKTNALFKSNGIIAGNLMDRLTELVPGGKAPDFSFKDSEGSFVTLANFKDKHLYIHFYDPNSIENQKEVPLLIELYGKYNSSVQFITVYKDQELDKDATNVLSTIKWPVYKVASENGIWKKYKIESYPYYTLVDAAGYVVMSPALGPTPNGQYQTIDYTFFNIQKAILNHYNDNR